MNKTTTLVLFLFLNLIVWVNPVFADEHATKEECVMMCEKAAKLFAEVGEKAALEQLNDRNGPFVWKDGYIFVLESDTAILVAHPIKPHLVGKNLVGMKDVNGKLFFLEFANVANSKEGKGWVDYMWPKPGEKKPVPKVSYIYKVPGMKLAVGAGVYQ